MADFIDGHARVLAVVRAMHKERTGHEYGAAAWLAAQLGCTRQSVDNYGKSRGFPKKYAAKLMKITGLTEDDIWPGVSVTVDFPTEVYDEVCTLPDPVPIAVVKLVRIGLKSTG